MDTNRKPLIVGNWKMSAGLNDAIKLVTGLKNQLSEPIPTLEVVLAPPYTSLYSVSIAAQDTPFKLAGQNCFYEEEGAFTGEISPMFLKEIGCEYVILGHSERRHLLGESDEVIQKKVKAALGVELTPILCVGETAGQRSENKTFEIIERQVRKGLQEIGIHDFTQLVIAYEPVWAIGTGQTASPSQAGEVQSFIRNLLTKIYDTPTANQIRILYGGSVKADNAKILMDVPAIDGLLVGGASLSVEQFVKIVCFDEQKVH